MLQVCVKRTYNVFTGISLSAKASIIKHSSDNNIATPLSLLA